MELGFLRYGPGLWTWVSHWTRWQPRESHRITLGSSLFVKAITSWGIIKNISGLCPGSWHTASKVFGIFWVIRVSFASGWLTEKPTIWLGGWNLQSHPLISREGRRTGELPGWWKIDEPGGWCTLTSWGQNLLGLGPSFHVPVHLAVHL